MNNSSSAFENLWLAALDRALRDPALAESFQSEVRAALPFSSEKRRAALCLAAAIGDCRLHSVTLPKNREGVLPETIALEAAGGLEEMAVMLYENAEEIGDAADQEESPQMEIQLQDILQSRMTCWAALLALNEANWEYDTSTLNQAVGRAQEAINRVDELLTTPSNLVVLSIVTATPALDNMRRSLAADFQDCLPWWLDGTLEETHEELRRICEDRPRIAPLSTKPIDQMDFLARLEIGYALAAEARSDEGFQAGFSFLSWRSPKGDCRAVLAIPPRFRMEDEFVLAFWREGQLAVDLASQTCTLADMEGTIDPSARAVFSAGRLLEQQKSVPSLELRVGESRVIWEREPQ